jgi:large subunit ribosomal protein L7Ae
MVFRAVCDVFCVAQWGGGIMGMKSQHKQKQKERILAKELAQRAGV